MSAARYLPGAGHGVTLDDFKIVTKARKAYPCAHKAPNARRRLPEPCAGPVEVGDTYARTRQSWLDWEPVNLQCLLDAGVLEVAE